MNRPITPVFKSHDFHRHAAHTINKTIEGEKVTAEEKKNPVDVFVRHLHEKHTETHPNKKSESFLRRFVDEQCESLKEAVKVAFLSLFLGPTLAKKLH
jgi:hypothetical protein